MANYMQTQFENLLKRYGHNIYLQRRSQGSESDVEYLEPLEKHTVRYSIVNSRSLMNRTQEMMEGILSTSDRVYYFTVASKPFDGDRIYEQDDRIGQTVWTIDTTVPMRGSNGEIIFYTAGVTRYLPN